MASRDRDQRIYEIVDETIPPGMMDVPALSRATRLVEDIGADSLDLVQLEIELEKEFSIEIPDEDVASWRTIGDVIDSVELLTK